MCVRISKILFLFCAIILPGQGSAQVDDLIDRLASEYVRKPNTRALAIGILNNRNSTRFFYGQVAAEDARLPDENTLFGIGPVGTTFTATLLAALSMEGIVDPEVSIVTYLPDSVAANDALKPITLTNLANHSSGLPDRLEGFSANIEDTEDSHVRPAAILYDFLHKYEPEKLPGETFRYSTLGFELIAVILSEITGKTYAELIDEYVTTPLSLTHTTNLLGEDHDLIPEHNQFGAEIPRGDTSGMLMGVGTLKSSLTDMLTYIRTHFESPDTDIEHALALTRQFTFFDPPVTDIGLAWSIHLRGDNLVYLNHGEGVGSSSYVAFAPDKKIALIILSNALEPVDLLGNEILEALLSN